MFKTIYNIIRALVTAPDVIHWVKKYQAVKEENKELRLRNIKWTNLIQTTELSKNHCVCCKVCLRDNHKELGGFHQIEPKRVKNRRQE